MNEEEIRVSGPDERYYGRSRYTLVLDGQRVYVDAGPRLLRLRLGLGRRKLLRKVRRHRQAEARRLAAVERFRARGGAQAPSRRQR